jgi:hypothetical protein
MQLIALMKGDDYFLGDMPESLKTRCLTGFSWEKFKIITIIMNFLAG